VSTASIQDAVAVAVTKGVLSMLERSTLPQIYSFTPERSYADWDLELKDFDKLRVDVVCNSTAQVPGLEARGKVSLRVPVDIATRKRFSVGEQDDDTGRIDVAEVDRLMKLTEQLYVELIARRGSESVWTDLKILAAPIHKHLRDLRQFTSVIRVTFKETWQLPEFPVRN
jgi:hypothetical protein